MGLAIGYGSDYSAIGSDGTSSTAQNFDSMFYASWQPFDGWFLDGVLGYGTMNFDNTRFSTFDNATLYGTRGGSEWFGSLTVSKEFKSGPVKISPYVRADFMSASLQGYAEQGTSGLALTYGGASFDSAGATVGLRGSYDVRPIGACCRPPRG